jgi:hypothetical protein
MNAYRGTNAELTAEWSGKKRQPVPAPVAVVEVLINAPPGVQVNVRQNKAV